MLCFAPDLQLRGPGWVWVVIVMLLSLGWLSDGIDSAGKFCSGSTRMTGTEDSSDCGQSSLVILPAPTPAPTSPFTVLHSSDLCGKGLLCFMILHVAHSSATVVDHQWHLFPQGSVVPAHKINRRCVEQMMASLICNCCVSVAARTVV